MTVHLRSGDGSEYLQIWAADPCSHVVIIFSIDDVIDSGKRHGATEEDLFGCLFFHIRDELKDFATRLRKFNVNIRMSAMDACDLVTELGETLNGQEPLYLDRIEVSNITDIEYVGLRRVLSDWAPLLNPANPHSTLVGLFLNWHAVEPGAQAESAGKPEIARLIMNAVNKTHPNATPATLRKLLSPISDGVPRVTLLNTLDLLRDNSPSFLSYLRKQQVESASQAAGVRLRISNKIVPSVSCSP